MAKKRINITVSEELYSKLQRLKDMYGFKNVCEMNVSLLNILCQYIEAAEFRAGRVTAQPEDYGIINDMFNELGEWEQTPANVNPPKRKRSDGER